MATEQNTSDTDERLVKLYADRHELLQSLREMVHFDDLPEGEQQPAVEKAMALIARLST